MAASKVTQNTLADKNSNTNYPKSLYSISDVNKLYRRQQTYKKKLKGFIETNCLLEARIRIYESTIKDQRSTILFQLNELTRTMNSKISTYVDQKLDKDKFKDNDMALQTIKQMINKFQTVQKQTKVTKKVYQNLNSIQQRYLQYSQEINTLVKMTQKSNKQYEDGMKNMLSQKQNQIISKRQNNQDIYDNTQIAIKKIDEYEAQKIKLIEEQSQLLKYVQKLKKIQQQTKVQVEKFTQWAQIVIDKNHRKIFNKQNQSKQLELKRITQNNKKLEVYFKELQNQEELLKSQLQLKQKQLTSHLIKKNAAKNFKLKNQRNHTNNPTISRINFK